jgi:outer membrane scaffolding protein for murein synthesis (MipA/OmpV family)
MRRANAVLSDPSKMKFLPLIACFASLVVGHGVAYAQEQDRDGLHLALGAVGVYRPEYKGAKDYEAAPLPFVGFRYGRGDFYVSLEGRALRANVLPGGWLEVGPIVTFERGRDNDIENEAVRRLGEIDDAVNAGVFARKRFGLAGGQLKIGGEVLTDTGKVHEGVLAEFGIDYDRPLSDRWSVGASLSTTWADRKYMQTYYGVSGAGALASGLSPYGADKGIENVEAGATLRYRINDRWSALANASYRRLVDSAADSPIVAREGSADQGQLALALFYSF